MILLKPVITEKNARENKEGKYTFIVHPQATKIDIANSFRKLYGVKTASVNILHIKEKSRTGKNRKSFIKRYSQKKAVITTQGKKQIDISKFSKK